MRSFFLFFLAACFGLVLSLILAGCGGSGSGSHGPKGNQYLVGCSSDADRVVFVEIELPTGYYGLLVETSRHQLGQTAVDSGVYNLGVFEPGTYEFSLELIARDVPAPRQTSFGPVPRSVDGVIETCELLVDGVIGDPVDDDCPPNVVVNVNEEGGIVFVIDGCWSDCEPIFEIEFLGETFVVDGNDTVTIPFDLEPGEYPWSISLAGGCGSTELDDGIIIVVGISEDEDPLPPDDLLPPAWGRHKILVCKDGRNKLLPYPAACNLIRQGKATLGACEPTRPNPRECR